MAKMILRLLVGFILVGTLLMSGCNTDRTFALELWVRNDISHIIIVEISEYFDDQKSELVDTTFFVQSNDSLMIHFSNPIGNARDLYPEGFIALFDSIKVSKEDGTISSKEFSLREEWGYERVGENGAVYTLLIDESDF